MENLLARAAKLRRIAESACYPVSPASRADLLRAAAKLEAEAAK